MGSVGVVKPRPGNPTETEHNRSHLITRTREADQEKWRQVIARVQQSNVDNPMSDREIARWCGVSWPFVAKVRRQLLRPENPRNLTTAVPTQIAPITEQNTPTAEPLGLSEVVQLIGKGSGNGKPVLLWVEESRIREALDRRAIAQLAPLPAQPRIVQWVRRDERSPDYGGHALSDWDPYK